MPYDVKRFIFSVSLCAMLAANPVLATAPTNDEELGTTHDVYVESTLNQATNGIAGVSYVNRMVNAAGNAADAAEAHAAAAGAHALSAAQSADEAHKVLADKVNIDQGADKKNLAMVTDDKGTVYPGYITNDMIAEMSVSATNKLHAGNYNERKVLKAVASGLGANPKYITTEWGFITEENIADDAVTSDKIADDAVTSDKIADGTVTLNKLSNYSANGGPTGDTLVLAGDENGFGWSKINGYMLGGYPNSGLGFLSFDGYGMRWQEASVPTYNIIPYNNEGKMATTGVLKVGGTQNSGYTYVGQITADDLTQDVVTTDAIINSAITSAKIANGAVTIDKTAGVVGMVPVGSADATTYGQFWIE